jgi:FkbM family methyltransferase
MVNLRWMRAKLARWVPEPLKAPFRARLFGYGAAPAGAGTVRTEGAEVVAELGGVRLRAPAAAAGDLRYHLVDNADSVHEMEAVLRAARDPGGLLMDVGAARGLISTMFCLAGRGNRAVAYEPSPVQADDAVRTAEMNGVAERVAVRAAAVGAAPAMLRGAVDAIGLIDLSPAASADQFDVEMTTLDAEMERVGIPRVVKIDVEGYEMEVLRGAAKLLRDHHPLLLLELHLDLLERRGIRPGEIVGFLVAQGYRFERSTGRPLSPRAVTGSPNAVLRLVAR